MKYVMEILPSLRGLNKFVKWILKNEMRWDDGYFQESCKIITIPTQWNFKPYRNQKQNVLLSDNQNWNRVYRSAVVHSKLIRYENQMSRGSGAESCGVEQKHPTPGQVIHRNPSLRIGSQSLRPVASSQANRQAALLWALFKYKHQAFSCVYDIMTANSFPGRCPGSRCCSRSRSRSSHCAYATLPLAGHEQSSLQQVTFWQLWGDSNVISRF